MCSCIWSTGQAGRQLIGRSWNSSIFFFTSCYLVTHPEVPPQKNETVSLHFKLPFCTLGTNWEKNGGGMERGESWCFVGGSGSFLYAHAYSAFSPSQSFILWAYLYLQLVNPSTICPISLLWPIALIDPPRFHFSLYWYWFLQHSYLQQ